MTIYITITVPINVIILLMFGLITYMSHLYINQPSTAFYWNFFSSSASAIYAVCNSILERFIRVTLQKLLVPECDRSELLDFEKSAFNVRCNCSAQPSRVQ